MEYMPKQFRPFLTPSFVVLSLILAVISHTFAPALTNIILLTGIGVGSLTLIRETIESLLHKQLALDYIAILAISTGVLTGNNVVAGVIVLMLSGGNALEEYAMSKAKDSLTKLADRIPNTVQVLNSDGTHTATAIESIHIGTDIIVRRGEVIPLDGELVSKLGMIDESSLTGEANFVEKRTGDLVRSGTINTGDVLTLRVLKEDKDSTYRKIITMVQQAQEEKAPLIRLADKYSGIFTLMTFAICIIAYLISHDFTRVLAVLVIATPCPLILATPIALMGGLNAAARKRIIVKHLGSLEALSRTDTIIFDKTGTITLGKPIVSHLEIMTPTLSKAKIYAIAHAIERNSLHPLAKALIHEAKKHETRELIASNVKETLGIGISATIEGRHFTLKKAKGKDGMQIALFEGNKQIALFTFEDAMKAGTGKLLRSLHTQGCDLYLFTGDKLAHAKETMKAARIEDAVTIKAECTPEEKQDGIRALKDKGAITAMVGDGINDAPALALADVGLVFSNEEHTAASEAADIVFLSGNIEAVHDAFAISKRTIHIAMQSIIVGIGLSTIGMLVAGAGYIPPVVGAGIQEVIDVAVILNALRASRNA